MTAHIKSNAPAVARTVNGWARAVKPAAKEAARAGADVLRRAAVREAPGNGPLSRSIRVRPAGGESYTVGPDVPYTGYVVGGTRRHVITPRRGKALFWRGARFPVRRVEHPGTRANPFMRRALRSASRDLQRAASGAAEQIVGAS